jgi:hypothetical protein
LGDLFDADSVQSILSIHIPTIRSFDKWIWAPSSSGTFSVRSAQEISSSPGTRSPPFGPDTWHALWSLKLQARLKHLLWKVAWNMLPSRDNISRFVVSEDPNTWNCPFCNCTVETLNHIFLDCDLARILWRSSPWPLNPVGFALRPISDWILAIVFPSIWLSIPTCDSKRFQIFASLILDVIWMARNKLVHEAIQPDPLPSLWSLPPPGSFKANFDVAVRGNFSVAAAIITDSKGQIITAASLKLSSSDALIGEASAALLATRLALSVGVSSLFLEGDALLVILAINQPSLFSSWSFANVISNISLDLISFQSWYASKFLDVQTFVHMC